MNKRIFTPILLLVLVALIAGSAFGFGSASLQRTVSEMFISLVLVVGIYIFVGNSGILSFGHIGFMSIGAYVMAWLTLDPMLKSATLTALPQFLVDAQLDPWQAVLLAALVPAAVALLIGAVLMRLSSIAASISSFAFMAIVFAVASNWSEGTGGLPGLLGLPDLASLAVTFVAAFAAICVAYLYDESRWGLALRAVREEEVAAVAMGLVSSRSRLIAFVVSAAVVGVAGALHASFLGVVSPDAYYIDATFAALAMLVIGGMYSLSGAVVGTVAVTVARQLLLTLERGVNIGGTRIEIPDGSQEFIIAILMCITLVYWPKGLMGDASAKFARLFWQKGGRNGEENQTEADMASKGEGQNT